MTDTFVLFVDYADTIKGMSEVAAGILFKMIYNHVTGAPETDGIDIVEGRDLDAARIAYGFISRQIDRSTEAYEELKAKRREAGAKGAAKRWQTMANDGKAIANDSKAIANDSKGCLPIPIPNPIPIPTKESKAFKRPTTEEVREYCRQRGNNVDAEQFVDYYTANGWKVGRSPMKDWRATVRTWERRGSRPPAKNRFNDFQQHEYNFDELEKELLAN